MVKALHFYSCWIKMHIGLYPTQLRDSPAHPITNGSKFARAEALTLKLLKLFIQIAKTMRNGNTW